MDVTDVGKVDGKPLEHDQRKDNGNISKVTHKGKVQHILIDEVELLVSQQGFLMEKYEGKLGIPLKTPKLCMILYFSNLRPRYEKVTRKQAILYNYKPQI